VLGHLGSHIRLVVPAEFGLEEAVFCAKIVRGLIVQNLHLLLCFLEVSINLGVILLLCELIYYNFLCSISTKSLDESSAKVSV
jgi:hypothetical protein